MEGGTPESNSTLHRWCIKTSGWRELVQIEIHEDASGKTRNAPKRSHF